MSRQTEKNSLSPIVSSMPRVSKKAAYYLPHLMELTAKELDAPFSDQYLGKQYKIYVKTDG